MRDEYRNIINEWDLVEYPLMSFFTQLVFPTKIVLEMLQRRNFLEKRSFRKYNEEEGVRVFVK